MRNHPISDENRGGWVDATARLFFLGLALTALLAFAVGAPRAADLVRAEADPDNAAESASPKSPERAMETRTHLGVAIQDLTADLAHYLRYNGRAGIVVGEVEEDSPAAKAGVQRGDILVSFDGQSIFRSQQLVDLVADHEPGDKVELAVIRDGEKTTLSAKLGSVERPVAKEKRVVQTIPQRRWNHPRIVRPAPRADANDPKIRRYRPDPSHANDPDPTAPESSTGIAPQIDDDPALSDGPDFNQDLYDRFRDMRRMNREMEAMMEELFDETLRLRHGFRSQQRLLDPGSNWTKDPNWTTYWDDSWPDNLPSMDIIGQGDFFPRVTMDETDDACIVRIELKGLKDYELEYKIDDGTDFSVTGKAKKTTETSVDGQSASSEYFTGSFQLSRPLPCPVDSSKIEEKWEDDALTLTLPKS